jgi:hypothetical protein
MITPFHPPATFSVRFVPVSMSSAGEKVRVAGENRYWCGAWCVRDQAVAIRAGGNNLGA